MAADGGDAKQLTQAAKGVFDYNWSPDGKTMVVCGDVEPEERVQDGPDNLPQVTVVRRVRYRYDTLGWRGDSHFHLSILDLESLESRQITDGETLMKPRRAVAFLMLYFRPFHAAPNT